MPYRWIKLLSCLVLWLAAAASRVDAQPQLVVHWTAPNDCPSEAEVLERVEHAMAEQTLEARIGVTATVNHEQGVYRAVLRIRDKENVGERTLEHARCDVLADSVALVIALSASAPAQSRERQSGSNLVFAISAHAAAVSGPMPRLALGGGAGLALEGPAALRWELSTSTFAKQTQLYDQLPLGANFQMFRVAARSCRVWTIGMLDLGPCLGAELFYVRGTGLGGMAQQHGAAYVWGPELSVLLRVRVLQHLAFVLSTGATLTLSRQRFRFSDLGTLHQPSAVAFQAGISPEVLF